MGIAAMMASCSHKAEINPFFTESKAPFAAPMFGDIKPNHYMPAFIEGMKQQNAEIDAIINNQEEPNFANTIEAIEYSGSLLTKVSGIFFNVTGFATNDTIQAIEQEVSPILTAHSDNISLNDKLFARIKSVYENQDNENLTGEQKMVLKKYYEEGVRAGALLEGEKKERLKEINKELGLLSIRFAKNVLDETNSFQLVIDNEKELAGLPDYAIAGASEDAKNAGYDGKWMFTLHRPSIFPFLQYAESRDLREKIYKGYVKRGDNNNDNDNKEVIRQLLSLRNEKAQLLGFATFADYNLDARMAKKPENVYALLNNIWDAALPKAKQEAEDMQKMINKEGGNFKLAAWDWWYYTEKIRKERFSLDEAEVKPYFAVGNVLDGAFMVANKLWGLTFTELNNVPLYHPEVRVFEVKDENDAHLSLFYVDYFPRKSKRAGAWMSSFEKQFMQGGEDKRPFIVNVGNFSKPIGDNPALLNIDEVNTLFHEFGHALHGMLSKCTYPKVSGTSVARDFVELPSQIMEHWAFHPEVVTLYAKHYQTGEAIPASLVEKINNASTFNTGFTTTELVAAALLDMNYHTMSDYAEFCPLSFENETTKKIGLIDEITYRYRGTYFSHIFSGGYATGYYSYLWAEVLDADAFDAFEQNGVFDKNTGKLFRENILEKGGSVEPMVLYQQFRGAEPNPAALLRNRGLSK